MKTILLSLAFILAVPLPAFPDATTALTEVLVSSGVPGLKQRPEPGLHGVLGAGLFNGRRIVGDSLRRSVFLPLILATYDGWAYWAVGSGGLWLYHCNDGSCSVGVGVKLRSGYRPDGDPLLAGMEKRSASADGYVKGIWRTAFADIGATYYRDIGRVNEADSATIRFSRDFLVRPSVRVTPSAGFEWESTRLVDYYYGVRPSEAQPGRPSYRGHSVVNYGGGLSGAYLINRSWCLIAGFYVNHLSNGISDSPIVSRRHTKVVYLGAGWVF